jgi:hypothetical protein
MSAYRISRCVPHIAFFILLYTQIIYNESKNITVYLEYFSLHFYIGLVTDKSSKRKFSILMKFISYSINNIFHTTNDIKMYNKSSNSASCKAEVLPSSDTDLKTSFMAFPLQPTSGRLCIIGTENLEEVMVCFKILPRYSHG